VTTPIGNEGIHAKNGKSIIVENTLKGQVNAIVALIENPAHHKAIAMSGREFVGQNFKWMEIIEHLEEICALVAHSRRLKTGLQPGMASKVP